MGPGIEELLKEFCLKLGFSGVGIAQISESSSNSDQQIFYHKWLDSGFHGEMDYLSRHKELRGNPQLLLEDVKSVIMVRLNYSQDVSHVPGAPRVAKYARGRDYHKVIRSKLGKLAKWLENRALMEGIKIQSRVCVDSAPFSEREYAQKAGLGWFGKNSCLIDSKSGSFFFIGSLLTTLDLRADSPATGGCGKCRSCIDACPTGAIVKMDDRWCVDARACISYLTIEKRGEFSEFEAQSLGDWTFGCDICQDVCPFNEARETQPLRNSPTKELDFLDYKPGSWSPHTLSEIVNMSESQFDIWTQGRAVRRAGLNGLKRNARANLVNLEKS